MTVKSEDVYKPKPTKRPSRVVEQDINLDVNSPQEQLMNALDTYEDSMKELTGGRVLLKMERENMSFTTPNGVIFSRDNPYQLVDAVEVDVLLRQNFRKAYPEEVRDFYEEKN